MRPSRLGDVLPPPVHRREFWLTVILVVLVTVVHGWMEYQHILDEQSTTTASVWRSIQIPQR